MDIAIAASKKAIDDTQVGAVLVQDDRVISTGFNGFPRSIPSEDEGLLVKIAKENPEKEHKDGKNGWVVHAEVNAIANAARQGIATLGAKIYVTHKPCFNCLKLLVQSGLTGACVDDMTSWRHERIDPDGTLTDMLLNTSGFDLRQVAPEADSSARPHIPKASAS